MKRKVLISIFILQTFLFTPSAHAHAQLTSSNPQTGSTITSLPTWVWVEFDGYLMTFGDKNPNTIQILDSKKKRVDTGGSIVGGSRLSTHVKAQIKAGKYIVKYRVVSEDGHPVEGQFTFNFRP